MPTPLETTIAAGILTQISKDLLHFATGKAKGILTKLQNEQKISNIEQKIRSYEKVKTLWQREKDSPLSEFYYPSTIIFTHPHRNIHKIKSLRDLPQDQHFVIEGIVGQGKSIFLRYLCVQELSTKSSKRIPILVELRKLDLNHSLKEAVFESAVNLGLEINDEIFDCYAKSGKFVILLDGFDELDELVIKKTITTIENWAERYNSCQMIITSRPNSDITRCRFFQIVYLSQLSKNDFKPFLTKIGIREPTLSNLLDAIDQCPSEISGLLITPLLLTLLAYVYQADQAIPNELPDFFQRLFAIVFSRHDSTKPGFRRTHKTGLSETKIERLFEAFCFSVLKHNYTVALTADQFYTAFQSAEKLSDTPCDKDSFLHDITKTACLMQDDGNIIEFIHKSLLDYFAAAFVKHCTEGQAKSFYQQIINFNLNHTKWTQTLQFLSKIDTYRYIKYCARPLLTTSIQDIPEESFPLNDAAARNYFDSNYKDSEIEFTIRNYEITILKLTTPVMLPTFILQYNPFESRIFFIVDFHLKAMNFDDIKSIIFKAGYTTTDNTNIIVRISDIGLTLEPEAIDSLCSFIYKCRDLTRQFDDVISKEEQKKDYMLTGF